MDPTQGIEKLAGAVKDLADGQERLKKALDDIKGRADNPLEIPALKTKWDALEKALNENKADTGARLKEVTDALAKYERLVAAQGEAGGSELVKYDPGYHAQDHSRVMPNRTAAAAFGHFMSVVVTGNAKSKQALEKHGLEVKRVEDVERAGAVSSDELGGYLSPPEFGGVITAAMKAYGILPQFADPVPMGSDKTTFAKDSNDMEVVAVEEGEELPEKALNFEQLTLEAKLFGAYGVWSVSLDEDAVVNYGELWANRIARGMARKVDDCGFLGDGTKPFNKFVGLLNHADVTVVTMPAGKTGFGDIAYKDFINLFGSVAAEVRREGNCRVLVSSDLEYILADVKDGVGRPLFTEPTNGAVSRILGKDVTYADILPGLADEAPGTKFGIFGDLRRAIKLGTRSRLVIAYSPHARFRNAQNAIRALSRWGVKVAWPNAAAIIKTADA